MACSPELSASLFYLTNAAHVLRTVAPETSAHLMSQRASLLYHHDMAVSETQRQRVCGACGHIMIPGREGTRITLESTKRKRRRGAKAAPTGASPSGPVKIVSCGLCHRATRTCLPRPEKVTRRGVAKAVAPSRMPSQIPSQAQSQGQSQAHVQLQKQTSTAADKRPDPVAAANASSKKRAKSRKAGLQALLSGQQQRQSNPLSLADFKR